MPEQAFISIGSNVEPEKYLPLAVDQLNQLGQVTVVSNVYQSEAVGSPGAPDFLNAAALLCTSLTAPQIRDQLRRIEKQLGRVRQDDKSVARTIDLDLCLYGSHVVTTAQWSLPHREVTKQAYVAVPLAELAPDFVHPTVGQSLQDLAQSLAKGANLTPRPDVILVIPGGPRDHP